jgi:hypothetical protein
MSIEQLEAAKKHIIVSSGSLGELNSVQRTRRSFEQMPGYLFVQGLRLPEETEYGSMMEMMDTVSKLGKVETETFTKDLVKRMTEIIHRPEFVKRDLRLIALEAGADGIIHCHYCGDASFNYSTGGESFGIKVPLYSGSFVKRKR